MKKRQSKFYQSDIAKRITHLVIVGVFILYFIFVGVSAFKSGGDNINFSGVEITTNSAASVTIDNVKVGNVSAKESLIYTKIQPGNHRLKVTKNEDTSLTYEKDIVFEKGAKVTVDWNFGVNNDTSSGIIKYFIKKSEDKNKIRIISLTPQTNILIDDNKITMPVIDADNQDHNLEISKEGYISKIITLRLSNSILSNSGTQPTPKYDDYDLIVEVQLFQIPFALN